MHAVGLCEPWLGGVVRVAGVHSRTGAGVSVVMSSRTSSSGARSVSRLRARCCNNQSQRRDVILLLTHFQTQDKSDRNTEHVEADPTSTHPPHIDKVQKVSGVQMQQRTAPT